jgi:hypothetical protein
MIKTKSVYSPIEKRKMVCEFWQLASVGAVCASHDMMSGWHVLDRAMCFLSSFAIAVSLGRNFEKGIAASFLRAE